MDIIENLIQGERDKNMRRISYGINSYDRTAKIYIEYSSPLISWLDWLFDWICFLVPEIPFLPIPIKLRDSMSIEFNNNKEWTNLHKWYGDLNSWFCATIHSWVSGYCWERTDGRYVKISYDELKKAIYDKEKEFWDQNIEMVEKIENEKD